MMPLRSRTYTACSGCSLCLLSCPVWRNTHDIRLTPHGRAKAMQHGATAIDLAESLDSCTLCGACEPACPESIDLVGMVTGLRGELALQREATPPFDGVLPAPTGNISPPTMLIADQSMSDNPGLLRSIIEQLGGDIAVSVSSDSGTDISIALSDGLPIPAERLEHFLAPLRTTLRVIVADGRLFYALKNWLHGVTIASLGEALSALPQVRSKLSDGDLYVIESVAFHRDHERLISHYDSLRLASGCSMNLDLQRMAVPTTASARAHGREFVEEQVRWILQGRAPTRIVVEDLADIPAFQRVADVPVIHVGALL
ncbi:MAG: 4Fe-4S dicluster domain-containing protein [Rhodocyclaceae bacterium]|nr:4Fe-4S dicluster domain-containing protein [Rhodocyclaceae bacterium]